MTNKDKLTLTDKYNSSPKGWKAWLMAKSNINLLNELMSLYPKVDSIKEKMFWLANNLTDFPKCPTCGNDIKSFEGRAYKEHCCCSCAQKDFVVRSKLENTNLKKYGTKNAAQSEVVQTKMKQTCLERFGTENVFASDYGKEKIKKTNLERFGVENPRQSKLVQEKAKATLKERYDVTCGYLTNKNYKVSKGEIELYNFVKGIKPNAKQSDRNVIWPMELDIYIPDLNLGIEYDGDYWHNLPDMVERDIQKNKKCEELGIRLIRVKESEWLNNKDFVKLQIQEDLKLNG